MSINKYINMFIKIISSIENFQVGSYFNLMIDRETIWIWKFFFIYYMIGNIWYETKKY